MFFVFAYGSPLDGEASGGLADMKARSETLDEAQRIAGPMQSSCCDIEILDGATGDIWDYILHDSRLGRSDIWVKREGPLRVVDGSR